MAERKNLIRAREMKGCSKNDVAKYLGVTLRYIDMIEQGLRTPSLLLALKLEVLYGMPVGYLFPELRLKATGTEEN